MGVTAVYHSIQFNNFVSRNEVRLSYTSVSLLLIDLLKAFFNAVQETNNES